MRTAFQQTGAVFLGVFVVEVPVDPDVAAVEADTARVVAQAQEHGHGRCTGSQVRQRAACRSGEATDVAGCGQ